ncbi:MAG: branched-chain amino acid ABC transporter permease [Gammaproteobacteria bacterium]|nr:branched-chain amino acid ABC transporter permease [Gammaproteobacteria bacterium]MYD76902.1 branched-chain amino acid ABC transporter permease [Gammaproteobacteria bacterium]MYJ51058.1 branched-chain amino acid ABC transporter permease [Gammaproteobacteria bacterium]
MKPSAPRRVSWGVYGTLFLFLLAAPPVLVWADQPFYMDLLTRVLILSIAASSLNLILGYGGMISLGHAAFVGLGAYSVAIPSYYGIYSGYLHLGIAIAACVLFALVTGAICLRTRGVYFIMITLAFAQMLYFTFVSLEEYGADDGLLIYQRSEFSGLLNLENPGVLYYLAMGVLAGCLGLMNRLIHSRFGRVIVGIRHNEPRMQSLGYNTYRYKLACYAISGAMAGISGFLLGNFTYFISPEMMDWTRSGELIFMVVLGGTGVLLAPVAGTAVFLLLEEILSAFTVYWHLLFGGFLIAIVLFGRGGLHGLVEKLERRNHSR